MGISKSTFIYGVLITVAVVVVAILAFIGIMIGISAKRLSTTEVGLAYNIHSHTLSEEVESEGLHFSSPGFRFVIFPATFTTILFDDLQCTNSDGVQIVNEVSFQYRADRNGIYALAIQFQNATNYGLVMEAVGKSVVHAACSIFNTTEFQTDRNRYENTIQSLMVEAANTFFTIIADVQVRNIIRPEIFEAAVRNKETARENVNVARNQRQQRITEANTVLREAETNAIITVDRANSDARVALTQAQTEAMAILDEFEREAETYATIMETQGLTIQGMLAYLGTRVIGEAGDTVLTNVNPPAKDSYANEL